MIYSSPINIFVGTAYSGENEFDQCIKQIDAQKGVRIRHYIVFDKPILPAFEEMYSEWSEIKHEMDMFVQIDADVILNSDDCILSIYNTIKNTKYNVISYPLYDHFTNKNIWALNSYLPSIEFVTLKDKYKPDMEFKNAVRYPTTLNSEIKGEHSPNPSMIQAFHFGWHRELRSDVSPGQRKILRNLVNAPKTQNRNHAIAGMHFARTYKAKTRDSSPIEYTNPIFIEQFKIYEESAQIINGTI